MTDTTEDSRSWRPVAVAGPVVAFVLIVGPILLSRGSMPDPLNLSWDGSGVPKNPRSFWAYVAIQSFFAFFAAFGFLLGGTRRFARVTHNAQAILLASVATVTFALLSISTVLANRGADKWQATAEPSDLWLILHIVLPALVLAVAFLRCRDVLMPTPTLVSTDPSAGLDLAGTQVAVWHGSAHAIWPRFIAGACLIGALIAVPIGLWVSAGSAISIAVPCVIAGLVALVFSRIGVVASRQGLTVNYGPLPWPRSSIDMADITSVAVADVVPSEHGGWGYRGSMRLMKKAAVVIRAGEGIHLGLTDGREFVVTVDNADQGAGVLNDLLSTTTPAGGTRVRS